MAGLLFYKKMVRSWLKLHPAVKTYFPSKGGAEKITICIDRSSIRPYQFGDKLSYAYNFKWIPLICRSCHFPVDISEMEYEGDYSLCPYCDARGSLDDVELESLGPVLQELGMPMC
ncbi:hypothetical protein [Chitinophaga sp. CC14]|uniref:hypothetical protein n=1 Tax=Chitinophaga sp. CC14 TaxID=3029199 RepID=UPI003B9868BA